MTSTLEHSYVPRGARCGAQDHLVLLAEGDCDPRLPDVLHAAVPQTAFQLIWKTGRRIDERALIDATPCRLFDFAGGTRVSADGVFSNGLQTLAREMKIDLPSTPTLFALTLAALLNRGQGPHLDGRPAKAVHHRGRAVSLRFELADLAHAQPPIPAPRRRPHAAWI